MTHNEKMIGFVYDAEARQKLKEQMHNPLPKLGLAEVPSFDIDVAQDLIAVKDRLRWKDFSRLKPESPIAQKLKPDSPITCRFFNVTEFYKDSGMSPQDVTSATLDIVADLRENGCNAVSFYHEIYDDNGKMIGAQLCVAVPNTVPMTAKDGTVSIERDIESAGRFMAYLLDKDFASIEEVRDAFKQNFVENATQYRGQSWRR